MFRSVVLCVMLAVAQSQSCLKMSATVNGGLCAGMKISMGVCAAAGTVTSSSYDGTWATTADCNTGSAACTLAGATFNSGYCAAGGGKSFLTSLRLCCRLCLKTSPHGMWGLLLCMHQAIDCCCKPGFCKYMLGVEAGMACSTDADCAASKSTKIHCCSSMKANLQNICSGLKNLDLTVIL
jgi:hypothetical protein